VLGGYFDRSGLKLKAGLLIEAIKSSSPMIMACRAATPAPTVLPFSGSTEYELLLLKVERETCSQASNKWGTA
jgi:hypothetical protein